MAKAKREPIKYGKAVDYEKDVKAGLIIARTPSKPTDEFLADHKKGLVSTKPGQANTNLKDINFSQETLMTKFGEGKQEAIARKYYEANLDEINAKRKGAGLAVVTVDQLVTAANNVYAVLNDKGKKNPDLAKDVEKGIIVDRYPKDDPATPPSPPPVSKPAEYDKEVFLTEDPTKKFFIKTADNATWEAGTQVEAWNDVTKAKQNITRKAPNTIYTKQVQYKSANWFIKPTDEANFNASKPVYAFDGTNTIKQITKE